LFEILKPNIYVNSIYNINLDKLSKTKKIKGIIIDLDNTLVAWGSNEIDSRIIDWIKDAKKLNMKLCILSNSRSKRANNFSQIFDIHYFSGSIKPFNGSFIKALDFLGTENNDTIVIGDQIFTDIWGGNRLKLFTILVAPITKRDFIGTFFQRILEKIILYFWLKRGKIKKEIGNWP